MNGVNEIIRHSHLMDQFYEIVRDRDEQMAQASKILHLLTEQFMATIYLINNYGVMDKLIDVWRRDICIINYPENLWFHLQHILEQAPQQAIEKGFFEILYERIRGRLFRYHHYDLKCFALLLRCEEGQKRFVAIDGVKEMHAILTDPLNKLDSYENVILTLMNGIFAKAILLRCREFTDLPLIITNMAADCLNHNNQIFCFQVCS